MIRRSCDRDRTRGIRAIASTQDLCCAYSVIPIASNIDEIRNQVAKRVTPLTEKKSDTKIVRSSKFRVHCQSHDSPSTTTALRSFQPFRNNGAYKDDLVSRSLRFINCFNQRRFKFRRTRSDRSDATCSCERTLSNQHDLKPTVSPTPL